MWTEEALAERRAVLDAGNRLRARQGGRRPWPLEKLAAFDHRYQELLPEVTVARCPDTGALVRWPIDTAGLDGWFWRYGGSVRRAPASLPRAWLAMTGAMRLSEPVEHTTHRVLAGPGVPFVVPRILGAPGVRAVIAEVPVGAHTGWPITYFGPKPDGVTMVNLWGMDNHSVIRDGRWLGWDSDDNRIDGNDYALEPWLTSGKLRWIAPGDEDGRLREGATDCPYLDLPGSRLIATLQEGKVFRYA